MMKQNGPLGFLFILVLMLPVAALAQQDRGEARNAIEGISQQWVNAYNQGDVASVAELYTNDTRFVTSNGEVVNGRQAVQELVQGLINVGAKEVAIKPTEVEVLGDTAYAVGSQRFTNAEGEMVVEGYAMLILKQVAGEWKIYRQLANRRSTLLERTSKVTGRDE